MKIKKIFFLFLFTSALLSCNNAKVSIPDTIATKEEMAAIMLDMHLAEASMNLSLNPQSINLHQNSISVDILKKHHITKEKFDASFQFYTEHPDVLNEVYKIVLDDLSKLQAQVMNEK